MKVNFAYWWRGKQFTYQTILESARKGATERRKRLKQRARGAGMRLRRIVRLKADKT